VGRPSGVALALAVIAVWSHAVASSRRAAAAARRSCILGSLPYLIGLPGSLGCSVEV
jgi:hypothetical protein